MVIIRRRYDRSHCLPGAGGEIIIYTSSRAPHKEVAGEGMEAKDRKGPGRGKQGQRRLCVHWMGCTTCIRGDLFEVWVRRSR